MSRPKVIVAHVVFVDLVRSTALSLEGFREATEALRRVIVETEEYRAMSASGRAQTEETGDGLSIAFLDDPGSPVECIIEIWSHLLARPDLRVRVGIHSGPLVQSEGLRGTMFTGAAFAEAKRVMEAARPGQVLLSASSADVLSHFDRWKDRIGSPKRARGKDRRSFRVFEFSPLPSLPGGASSGILPHSSKRRGLRFLLIAAAVLGVGATVAYRGRVGPNSRKPFGGFGRRGPNWDLARDFGQVNLASSPWQAVERMGATFRRMSPAKNEFGFVWSSGTAGVWKNSVRQRAFGIDPGAIALDADQGTPDIRWTAPRSGWYDIVARLGGSPTGDWYGRGNYDADDGGMLINDQPVHYTSWAHNRMGFEFHRVRLQAGQTVDLFVRRGQNGGNTMTVFQIYTVDAP